MPRSIMMAACASAAVIAAVGVFFFDTGSLLACDRSRRDNQPAPGMHSKRSAFLAAGYNQLWQAGLSVFLLKGDEAITHGFFPKVTPADGRADQGRDMLVVRMPDPAVHLPSEVAD